MVKGVTLFVERDSVALMQMFVCSLLAKEKAENRAMRASLFVQGSSLEIYNQICPNFAQACTPVLVH